MVVKGRSLPQLCPVKFREPAQNLPGRAADFGQHPIPGRIFRVQPGLPQVFNKGFRPQVTGKAPSFRVYPVRQADVQEQAVEQHMQISPPNFCRILGIHLG